MKGIEWIDKENWDWGKHSFRGIVIHCWRAQALEWDGPLLIYFLSNCSFNYLLFFLCQRLVPNFYPGGQVNHNSWLEGKFTYFPALSLPSSVAWSSDSTCLSLQYLFSKIGITISAAWVRVRMKWGPSIKWLTYCLSYDKCSI